MHSKAAGGRGRHVPPWRHGAFKHVVGTVGVVVCGGDVVDAAVDFGGVVDCADDENCIINYLKGERHKKTRIVNRTTSHATWP